MDGDRLSDELLYASVIKIMHLTKQCTLCGASVHASGVCGYTPQWRGQVLNEGGAELRARR